ncbi:unnamed protein product, partial [Amoebophrya sp. A25]
HEPPAKRRKTLKGDAAVRYRRICSETEGLSIPDVGGFFTVHLPPTTKDGPPTIREIRDSDSSNILLPLPEQLADEEDALAAPPSGSSQVTALPALHPLFDM